MTSIFHAEEPLYVLQYKELRLVALDYLDDCLKKSSARVTNSKLLTRTAKWLAWKHEG
jgi:hypothetical protein